MRHLSITIVALLSMGLLQTSCSQNRGNVDVAPSLTVDSVGVEHEDSVGEFRISADFASGSDAVLVNSINEYIMETLNGQYPGEYMDFKAMLDFCLAEKVKEYHNDWKEMEVHLSGMHYLYDTSISLTYEGPRFVTYTNTCETFMGGAHGLYSITGQTFRRLDGRRFGWEIIANPYSEELQNLIKENLKDYFDAKTDEQLYENLQLESEPFIPLPKCPPLFEEEGVTFIYQQYEIAAYACGLPTFTVPYEKILPLLNTTAKKLVEK